MVRSRAICSRLVDRLPPPLHAYHTQDCALARLRTLAPRGLVEVRYGASARGRDLVAFRLGEGATRVLYLANIHAMEFLGTEVVLALADALIGSPPADREVWLVPCANPDGRAEAEDNARAGRRRFARRNARGVDLNRNFDVDFRADYWLHRLLPRVYAPGDAPFSEPEAAALRDLCAAHPPRFALSLHAFGGWVFYPWGARRDPTPDAERFETIADAMCARMPRDRYRHRQLGKWARWFRGHGMEIDHLYARHGTLAFLMEISRGGASATRPATWIDPLRWFNPPDPRAEVDNVLPAALHLATV